MTISVRPAKESDAANLISHRRALMAETTFMLYEQGELDKTEEDERARIRRLAARGNSTVLVAEDGQLLAGNLTAVGGEDAGLHRLELTVHTSNLQALGLYLRHGFQVEGVRRHSLLVDGRYVDEYLISRLQEG
jgi:hypothetical protein